MSDNCNEGLGDERSVCFLRVEQRRRVGRSMQARDGGQAGSQPRAGSGARGASADGHRTSRHDDKGALGIASPYGQSRIPALQSTQRRRAAQFPLHRPHSGALWLRNSSVGHTAPRTPPLSAALGLSPTIQRPGRDLNTDKHRRSKTSESVTNGPHFVTSHPPPLLVAPSHLAPHV